MPRNLHVWQAQFTRHWVLTLAALLTVVNLITFAPTFGMGFVTDDFVQVGKHHYDALETLAQDDLSGWLARLPERILQDPVNGVQVVRPTRILFFIADYFQWHLDPFGYHLTNLLFYFGACFVVGLLAWRLTRSRVAATLAALSFALFPVHAAPVAEIASRGHVMAGMFVALTVLFYVVPNRRAALMSWLTYLLALGSKETALITPVLLVLYEIVYSNRALFRTWRAVAARQLPLWLITLACFGFRFLVFRPAPSLGTFEGQLDLNFLVAGYAQYAVQPLWDDIAGWQVQVVLIAFLVLLLVYHRRHALIFGLLWYPIALLPALTVPPQERYFFTPSIGLALALASILAQPIPELPFRARRTDGQKPAAISRQPLWRSGISLVLAALLFSAFAYGLYTRNTEHRAAAQVIERILQQLKTLHPTLPRNAQLFMLNLPQRVRHGYIFTHPLQVEYAVKLAYADPTLRVATPSEFPNELAAPDRTFFLEYENRELRERAELVQAVRARRRCSDSPQNRIRWNFRQGAQGWEAWNEIEGMTVTEGALHFTTIGDDPFMGSPLVEIPPNALQSVEIQMRARADQPSFQAELYWQTTKMPDFAGDARVTFQVNADSASNIYRLEQGIAADAPIIRLRLDPSDVPAEIQLERITIFCR